MRNNHPNVNPAPPPEQEPKDSPPDKSQLPEIEVAIESVAFGGKGIARHEGKVIFVPEMLPGDAVRVQLVSDKGRYADGEVLKTVTSSPLRGESPCPVSMTCGGCTWLGVSYAQQLEWKLSFVRSSLERIGKLPTGAAISISGSPEQLHYRNRVHLKARKDPDGGIAVGYYRRGSKDLVAIDACAIAKSPINDMIAELANTQKGPACPGLGPEDFKIEIQQLPYATEQKRPDLLITVFPDKHDRKVLAPLVEWLKAHPRAAWAGFSFDRDSSSPLPFEMTAESLLLHGLPGQFQQVNTAANALLRQQINAMIKQLRPRRILDVCCGSGNLSLAAASTDCHVEGVEMNPAAIVSARMNLETNKITNALYLKGDSESHLWKCAKKGEQFDCVILDPPREGFYRGLVPLKKISPDHILYVSCDPATLARDIGALCRSEYEVAEVHAYDFFPNTWHVETLVRLQKKR